VLLTDHYGNLITNLRKTQFEEWVGNRKFEIKLGRISIKRLIDAYEDVVPENNSFEMHFYEGKEFARFNDKGYLEIGLYRSINDKTGNAKSLLGVDLMTEIRMYYE
ncbi:SAM hydroxide adenosyltransferase, partial [Arthrospira platensis SPKY1]|nr:SAM hydroxide adenosyltransferase [Arthrospira platensis SPKY1]